MIRAPTLIWRYILREAALYSGLVLCALMLLWMLIVIVQNLGLLSLPGASPSVLGRLLLVILPAYASSILPSALVFGVLIALARLSADSEIVALCASGLGPGSVLVPIAALGALCSALNATVAFELEPLSHHQLAMLRRELIATRSFIAPGRVKSMGNKRTLYVAELGDASCPLRGVVISDFRQKARPYYVSAACGTVVDLEKEGLIALDLSDGAVHLSHRGRGQTRYDRISFSGSVLELDLRELGVFQKRIHQYRFSELLTPPARERFGRNAIEVEIHRRLSFPLAGLVLSLLVVPLGVRPVARGGSSIAALTAVMVMGVYWCVSLALGLAAEGEMIPAWCLWLPNAFVLGLAAALFRIRAHGFWGAAPLQKRKAAATN